MDLLEQLIGMDPPCTLNQWVPKVRVFLFAAPSPKYNASHFGLSIPSGFYDEVVNDDGMTEGEQILVRLGFDLDGEA